MARTKGSGKGNDTKRSPLGRFGGVRMVQRRVGRSETLYQNKEMVAAELIALGTANITDIVNLDGTIKPMEEIPDHALAAIKKISVREGNVTIEMHDKVATLRVLAKASGMLDAEPHQEKPSIIGINMKGPAPVTEYEEIADGEESIEEEKDRDPGIGPRSEDEPS